MSERSVVFMFSGQGSHYYQIDTVSLRHGAEELRQVDLGTGLVRKPVSGCEAPGLARIASRIASRGGSLVSLSRSPKPNSSYSSACAKRISCAAEGTK
jgi:hypothetical protein